MVVLTREDDYHDRYRQQDKLKITGGREIDWPARTGSSMPAPPRVTLMLAAIDEGLDTAIFGVTDLPALPAGRWRFRATAFPSRGRVGYPAEAPDEPSSGAASSTRRRKPRVEVVAGSGGLHEGRTWWRARTSSM